MSVVDISQDFAQGFDAIREALLGADAKLILLQEEGHTIPFSQLQVIKTGWYPEYSSFFGNTTFHVADISEPTADNIRNASFVMQIDSLLPGINNVLFEIKPETAPPDSNKAWWRVRGTTTTRKYIPPQEV